MFLLKVFSNYGMFVLPDTLVVFSCWSMCYSKIFESDDDTQSYREL